MTSHRTKPIRKRKLDSKKAINIVPLIPRVKMILSLPHNLMVTSVVLLPKDSDVLDSVTLDALLRDHW
jgi:hypothetical protein